MGTLPLMSLPAYGSRSIADVLPSVAALLGVATMDDRIQLTEQVGTADRACVLLIDGLGWDSFRDHQDRAPFLASLLPDGRALTSTFPSTTATSLASFGTGLTPGEHGIVGYLVRIPGEARLMQSLAWDASVDPRTWQPHPPVFEHAAADGVAVRHVGPSLHQGTGLTTAVLRGADYRPADTWGEIVEAVADAARDGSRSLTYVYYGDLDKTGHRRGCRSLAWQEQLAHVDFLAEQIAARLPAGTVFVVTADHGMVDIEAANRIDLDGAARHLRNGITLVGGEPRARHLYVERGAAYDVRDEWRAEVGDRMWIATREEAVQWGWFGGVVEARVAPRIGDVVAVARTDVAVVASQTEPAESRLVGVHGSCTRAEQDVPLLVTRTV
jgi:hypothetical protein